MTTKFKVGDRVRYVSDAGEDPLPYARFGDEFDVLDVLLVGGVMVRAGDSWRVPERFELVEETHEWVKVPAKEIVKGDTIRYFGAENVVLGQYVYCGRTIFNFADREDAAVLLDREVEVKRPKALPLPTEPGVIFWGRAYIPKSERTPHRGYTGWFSSGCEDIYPGSFIDANGKVWGCDWVTRLPWPKDELEKFKESLA